MRIAERLSAAAEAVHANGLRRALSRVRLPKKADGKDEQRHVLATEERVSLALLLASYLALFRAAWAARDVLALQLLVVEPAHLGHCASTSPLGVMSWLVRRALSRAGAHPSFSWASTWSHTLSPEPGDRSTAPSAHHCATLAAGGGAAQSLGPKALGAASGAEEASKAAQSLANLTLETVILARVSSMLGSALSQSADGAASDDASCAILYR